MEVKISQPQLAPRRRRRRSTRRRVMRGLRTVFPLLLVLAAAGLSAGVVRVMEIGQVERDARKGLPAAVRAERAAPRAPARESVDVGRPAPKRRVEPGDVRLEDVLGASVLDDDAAPTAKDRSRDGDGDDGRESDERDAREARAGTRTASRVATIAATRPDRT